MGSPEPGIYPSANVPQTWAASAIVMIVQALLGARPAAPARLLLLDPQLPAWLPDMRLEGLRVGSAAIDFQLERAGGRTRCKVTRLDGSLRVVRQPAAQAHAASLAPRAQDLVRSPL